MLKKLFLGLSLNKKLILMMLFLSSILLSILMILYIQAEKATFRAFESQIIDLSKAIQVGVFEITSQGSTDEMRISQYLASLNAKGIKEISIISNEDEIIASTNPTKIGNPVGPKRKELIIKAELGEAVSREKEGKVYNVILPVIAGEEHHGYIHLSINTDDFSKVMRSNMIKRVIGTLLVFAVGIGIAMILAWKYTGPIHRVVYAAKRVAAGDLDQTLSTEQQNEIGELTDSFNFMVQKLREHRRLEEKLREAEHLSGIGQLSRSVAHEIRNPLNFINLSIDHIKEKYQPGDPKAGEKFSSLISSIKKEIQRLNKLVEDFLDYGKPLKLNLREVDVSTLLEDIMEIIWAKAEAQKIDIIKDYKSEQLLKLDPDLIKSCIFNVILNAFQAMPDGGSLTIKTEVSNGLLSMKFIDTGIGIPENEVHRIFDPFFTTKRNGLGLGLAMTKRVIEEHMGKVEISSVSGKGSTVSINLPLN